MAQKMNFETFQKFEKIKNFEIQKSTILNALYFIKSLVTPFFLGSASS